MNGFEIKKMKSYLMTGISYMIPICIIGGMFFAISIGFGGEYVQDKGIVVSNQQENREIGFRQYMKEHHPSCTILELDLHAERNDEDNEMLDEFFRTYPMVKNGITFNSKAYIVGEYLQSRGKKDFNLIGYDLLERNVTCLKEGSISFLIAQQPELQGANGIKALCDHLIFQERSDSYQLYAH